MNLQLKTTPKLHTLNRNKKLGWRWQT